MIGCAPHMRVADDDPDMRKMVRDYLTPKGCPVSQAVDGVASLVQVAAVAMMVWMPKTRVG